MSLRKSAPNGSPYQFRCSSRALAVASCCAASIASPHRFPKYHGSRQRTTSSILRRVVVHGDPQYFARSPGRPGTLVCGARRQMVPVVGRSSLRGLSSVGRALSLHGRCQGFDSPRLHTPDRPDAHRAAGRFSYALLPCAPLVRRTPDRAGPRVSHFSDVSHRSGFAGVAILCANRMSGARPMGRLCVRPAWCRGGDRAARTLA